MVATNPCIYQPLTTLTTDHPKTVVRAKRFMTDLIARARAYAAKMPAASLPART
jgi:hypothetical protein